LSLVMCAGRRRGLFPGAADLAVVKVSDVPKEQLKPLPLGSSAPGLLRVGQACLAIGNRECRTVFACLPACQTCSGNDDCRMAS
jgi:hypothetical protein